MEKILSSLADPRMIAALETNLEEEMMGFGRVLAGAQVYNDGQIEGFFTGREHLNGILRTHLKNTDADSVRNCIDTALRYFREKQVSDIGWSLGQDCQPANMATYLEDEGFRKLNEENIGMALEITSMRGAENDVEDLEIRELTSVEDLSVLYKMEVEGFNSSEAMAGHYCEMYKNSGFGRGMRWRHLGGWWRGEVVAATSLLFYAGVAGIYGVATVPQARKHGIARAMVLRAIAIARQEDYRIAILSPTNMSEGIYRRLGFRAYTKIRHYTRDV